MRNPTSIFRFSNVLLCVLLIVLIFKTQMAYSESVSVRLFEKVKIETDDIRIGQICDIVGNDQGLAQRIRDISMGKSPLPGRPKQLEKGSILNSIKQSGVDPNMLAISGPDAVVAERSSIELSNEYIEKIVLEFISGRLPYDDKQVKIDKIRFDDNVLLPTGNITYVVNLAKNQNIRGNTTFFVDFSVNGQFEKRVWVSANIDVFADVVATNKPLGKHQLITEDDIQMVKMNLADLPANIITNPEEAMGMRAKRAINYQEVLRPDLVEMPPLVKRGTIVSIIAKSETLQISTLGKAKERGHKGQMISVENIDSKKSVFARVLDSNTVVVDY
jgi:flagellar basal body P-ring formation protein FlgA